VCLVALGGAGTADAAAPTGERTFYTGIDPGAGDYYSYAPSAIETNPTTRYVFGCENYESAVVRDHVYLSVGHLRDGHWTYGPLKDVFGPQYDPDPHGYFSVHACEPEVIGGNFHFGGKPYSWALLFTAESTPDNATNQLGIAFANNLAGPWKPDLTPIVQTADDFGHNSYPYDCPPNLYCLGQPAAIDFGPSGHVLVTYMSNAGSPGNASAPGEGLVLRELNLSDVPATGPCPQCLVPLPDGKRVEAVTTAGLTWQPDDASIAYDSSTHDVVIAYDSGPPNQTADEAPVTPWITVATMNERSFLNGTGTWHVLGALGACISGHSLNHNAGLVRLPNGDMPSGRNLSMLYTVANHNIGPMWGVWGYRMWDFESALGSGLTTQAATSTNCSGFSVLTQNGRVTGAMAGFDASPPSSAPAVGLAATPDSRGYYVAHADGTVTRAGDAVAEPRPRGLPTHPAGIVGIALDPVTGGYWLADADGTVYGANATVLGSLAGTPHSGTVVAIASTPVGLGYYLVTSTGQVFTFGHAQNFGGLPPGAGGQAITAMAVTPDGLGYYLLSGAGAITTYGDAVTYGPSVAGVSGLAVGIAVSPDGHGYVVTTSGGQVLPYGDATALSPVPPSPSTVAVAFH
jgi:hypothetical protein